MTRGNDTYENRAAARLSLRIADCNCPWRLLIDRSIPRCRKDRFYGDVHAHYATRAPCTHLRATRVCVRRPARCRFSLTGGSMLTAPCRSLRIRGKTKTHFARGTISFSLSSALVFFFFSLQGGSRLSPAGPRLLFSTRDLSRFRREYRQSPRSVIIRRTEKNIFLRMK